MEIFGDDLYASLKMTITPLDAAIAQQVVAFMLAAKVRRRSQEMCRNIKMLFNFDPPVTPDEVRAASLQFVRKISGFNKPSKANEEAFFAAVDAIAGISANLLSSLETNSPPKNREEEAARLKARSANRFGDRKSLA
jgi:hypothetical protein